MDWIPLFNQLVGIGVIAGQVLVAVLVIELFVPTKFQGTVGRWLGQNGLKIAFLAALGASVGSLIYSNIIGYPPCTLCWWQRIFIYPEVIILGFALWRRDANGSLYGISVAIPGIIIALYHNWINLGGKALGTCGISTGAVSCTQRFIHEFGYITIPLMSLTVLLIILLSLISYRKSLTK
ncbi:MAG: disulfide bond formation protein B [Patescibacteria group bacterium]